MDIELKPKDFLSELLQALNTLSASTPNVALPWKDVADRVLQIKGYTLDDLGTQPSSGQPNGYRWIQAAFRSLKKEGYGVAGGSGKWAISQAGITKANADAVNTAPVATAVEADLPPSIPADAAIAATPAAVVIDESASMPASDPTPAEEMISVVEAAEAEVEEAAVEEAPAEEGRSWDFVVPPGDVVEPTADPYLLSLQTAAATCYGKFSDRSDLCRACPIRLGCFEQIKTALFDLREKQLLFEREAALAAQAPTEPVAEPEPEPEATPEPEPEPAPAPAHQYDISKAEDITATMETACVVCQKGVKQGTDCKWIPGVGVFHPDCL